ncbi:GAF domain-containing sensor histidine kinase [Funiculus sociatus GB2-A5]|uniref:histidine kinase n=3 Tax=Funiculus TaxID=2886342 RepID=A0ABV0JKW5_9CYAN|nr:MULTISPECIES: GAF domain-containing sensor histidine kinase [unclassified Trichocoleus]MBD1905155.1 GAF domain-containing protein [Trichocoleus sp. FACHB-832]MBD2060984.1 GAF domain-containing protein [Trichocoleus sp. FACHB-6]
MNDAQADMDVATGIAKHLHVSVSGCEALPENLAAPEGRSLLAPRRVDSFTSKLSSPSSPVFTQEHKGAVMNYKGDPIQIGQQITQILLNSPDPETVLLKIADVLGKSFQADTCLISSVASHQATPQTVVWCADDHTGLAGNLSEIRFKLWMLLNPLLEDNLSNNEPLAISDIHAIETRFAVEDPVRAVLVIQTQFQSQANGLIVIGRSQPFEWTDVEKGLLKAVADSVAIAISQVQLQRQLRIATQYQTLINQLTMAIRSAIEVNQILQMAIAGTAQALEVERGFILLLKYVDPLFKTRSLTKALPKAKVTVACEYNTGEQAAISEPGSALGESFADNISSEQTSSINPLSSTLPSSFLLSDCYLCQQAFQKAPEPVIITDKQDIPTSNGFDLFDLETMPALLMVPLESQGTVLGFLVLQHHQPRSWQSEELELVKWVSAQASTAIIQHQSIRVRQDLVEERTAQLQRSLEVQAKLYDKMRQQVEQLRQLNQIKDEFINAINHELKTPLTTMSVAIRMLRQAELPTERRAKYLEILDQQCTQEINLITDLLTLQKVESKKSPIELQKIDLKQVIQNLAEPFAKKWADKGLTLEIDPPTRSLMLQTDSDSLNRIIEELLTNAGKFSEPDSIVSLRVTHQVSQKVNQIALCLTNTGACISPTEVEHIFEKFRRGQVAIQNAVQGTGLGLALVKSLVQHINGAIALTSCPIEDTQSCETCFTLTLPLVFDLTKI